MKKIAKEKILKVKKLTIKLSDVIIVDELSFEVEKGEHLTIIGPNGSGKTTLFKALINTIPFQGEINWSSNTKIGYVPQKLDIERDLPLSLYDFLRASSAGVLKIIDKDIKECLELVHIEKVVLNQKLGTLSGGQFQRALVAFALLGNPDVLLFDEPTSGIDQPSEEQIYETLHRIQDEKGVTIITISHDLSLVHRHSDKVLCLNKRGICYGAPEAALDHDTISKLYGTEHHKYFHHTHDKH